MEQNAPKKKGILQAYLNFNVLYKILIGRGSACSAPSSPDC